MSQQRLARNEQFVLHCILRDNSILNNIIDNEIYFQSDIAKDIFESMKKVKANNLELTNSHILAEATSISDDTILDRIKSISDIDVKNFNTYYDNLRQEYAKEKFSSYILKNSVIDLSKKNDFDIEVINNYIKQAEECKDIIVGNDGKLLSGVELLNDYEKDIDRRLTGKFYSSGCSHFDSLANGGGFLPGEASLIFARSSNGKSTMVLNMINKMINKRIPVLSFSLEMSKISTMDRLICLRHNINLKQLYPKNELDNTNQSDYIYDLIKKEKAIFERIKTFSFLDESTLSLSDWKNYVNECKKTMKVDNINVVTDLLTMITEFCGQNKASAYEDGMNIMHGHIKSTNSHAFNVVQASREPKELSIKTKEDLQKLKLSIQDIKNSGALYERHRKVYSVFRPYFYALQYFQDKPELELIEDEMILQCLKDSHGEVGRNLKYIFVGENFKLLPIKSEDIE